MRKPGLCGRRVAQVFPYRKTLARPRAPVRTERKRWPPVSHARTWKHHKAPREVVDNYAPNLKKQAFFAFWGCFSRHWGEVGSVGF